MRSKTYQTEGIILLRHNYGEADRILTVLTKHYGKIRCLAKGVRKPTSRKSGHVELFDRSQLFLSRGRNLDYLTEVQVIERFPAIRGTLKAVKAAYHLSEIIDLLIPVEQHNPMVFEELVLIFRKINTQKQATKKQILVFEKQLLTHLGFGIPDQDTPEKLLEYIEEIVEAKLATVNIFKDI